MKPKLIILNGPSGIGKNTIAELYKKEHSSSLILDIDEVRRTIPEYRKNREESYKQACELAFAEVTKYLKKGLDVIIPNKIKKAEVLHSFKEIANNCNANFYEFVLWTTKEDSLARAIQRGFRPGSLLQESKLGEMYDELEESIKNRKNIIIIESKEGQTEEVYAEVFRKLNGSNLI